MVWGLVGGLAGTMLAGLWGLTDHTMAYHNENLLQLNPLILGLVLLAPLAVRGSVKAGRWAPRLALIARAAVRRGFAGAGAAGVRSGQRAGDRARSADPPRLRARVAEDGLRLIRRSRASQLQLHALRCGLHLQGRSVFRRELPGVASPACRARRRRAPARGETASAGDTPPPAPARPTACGVECPQPQRALMICSAYIASWIRVSVPRRNSTSCARQFEATGYRAPSPSSLSVRYAMSRPPAAGASRYPSVVPGWRRRKARTTKSGKLHIALGDFLHLDRRREGAKRNREDHRVHLPAQNLLQRDTLLRGAVDAERVAGSAQRLEEGQALDVIPVRVGQQDVGRDPGSGAGHQLVAQRAQPAAGVEDHQSSVRTRYADAGGVPAIARGRGSGSRDGTAGAPELQLIGHARVPERGSGMPERLPCRPSPATARVTSRP